MPVCLPHLATERAHVSSVNWSGPEAVLLGFLALGLPPDSAWAMRSMRGDGLADWGVGDIAGATGRGGCGRGCSGWRFISAPAAPAAAASAGLAAGLIAGWTFGGGGFGDTAPRLA